MYWPMKKYSTLLIMYEHLPINKIETPEPDQRLAEKVDAELAKLLGPKIAMAEPSEEVLARILQVARAES